MGWFWEDLAPFLMLLGSHFALLSTLSDQGDFFCPAILLHITYCISILLVSFKHQECCQSLHFQSEIWMSKNAIKLRMFYINTKALEKNPLQESQLNWFSHLISKWLWEKSYTHFNKNYTYFWSFNLFWQRFEWKLLYLFNAAWVKFIKNKRTSCFISTQFLK